MIAASTLDLGALRRALASMLDEDDPRFARLAEAERLAARDD